MKIFQVCWIDFQNNLKKWVDNLNSLTNTKLSATAWSQIIDNKNNKVFFVADASGVIIGYGVYTEIKNPSQQFAVTDYSAKDQDVFDLLIETLQEQAAKKGIEIKNAT